MADAVSEAQTRYQEALDALREQRIQIEEDLKFSDPSNPDQWDVKEKAQRESDVGGARPCLVHDQTSQYTSNVVGQIEKRPPALHAIPVDGGSDKKVAEQLDGLFRHIEAASRAQQHYMRAELSAGRAGVGYLLVRPEYTSRALGYQEPRIGSEGDPLRVVFDPWSVELDGSDANFGFLLTPFSHAEFDRRWPGKEKVSFGSTQTVSETDKRESILVAEEWRVEERPSTTVVYITADGDEASLEEDLFKQAFEADPSLQYIRSYKDKYRCVKWSRMSGVDYLDKETEYPADHIGIVPVYGYVGWSGGRMTYCGIPRKARAPQQAYNFHISEMKVLMQQAPKAPWMMPIRAFGESENIKQLWDRSSVESRSVLPYHDVDERGPINSPSRMPVAVDLRNHIQGALQAKEDIQAALGMYQANLGAPSNETSGVAIESRKQQGESSTSNFPANLAAGIGQVGRICMQMIPRLIDTKRQLRILGLDETPSKITIDPRQKEAVQETPQGLSINPNVGSYDVRVVVGASFSTQRQQAQQAYTEMMRANPQMMPAIGPLWAQTLDVPHADKLAQVLTAMAPDPVKAILQPEQHESTDALKIKLDQAQQALQEAIQHAKDAQQEADEARAELETKKADAEVKEDEVAIKAYDALTKRMQVVGAAMSPEQVQALVVQTMEQMLRQPDPAEANETEPTKENEWQSMDQVAMQPQQADYQPQEATEQPIQPMEMEVGPPELIPPQTQQTQPPQ